MRPTASQSANAVSQQAGSQAAEGTQAAAGSRPAGSQAADRQAPGNRAPGSRSQGRRAPRSQGLVVAYVLAGATAAALVIDAVVYLQDAYFYDANTGALLSQGQRGGRPHTLSRSMHLPACNPRRQRPRGST